MKTPLLSITYPYKMTFADAGKGASVQPYKFGCKPPNFLNQTLFAQRVYITQKPKETMNILTNIR